MKIIITENDLENKETIDYLHTILEIAEGKLAEKKANRKRKLIKCINKPYFRWEYQS